MITEYEDELICDFAEVYHIFNYRSLPVNLVVTLACGLRENSRTKMKMNGVSADPVTALLALAVDDLNWLVWSKTSDGHKNRNKPESVYNSIMGLENNNDNSRKMDCIVFDSVEDYKKAMGGNNER